MGSKNPVEFQPSNSLTAVWSMMLPGIGQLMKGRVMAGILWAILVGGGYFTYFWPGLIMHALCILDAAFYKGNGSLLQLDTWPKRFGFIGLVSFLLVYILIRNGFLI